MRVKIKTQQFDAEFFGDQEFIVLPAAGSSIEVMDRNSNLHFLKVLAVRQIGWKPDSEVSDLLEHTARSFGVVLLCEADAEWLNENKEAEKSAAP
jgi:hypothetical protein